MFFSVVCAPEYAFVGFRNGGEYLSFVSVVAAASGDVDFGGAISTEQELVVSVTDIVALYLDPPENAILVCVDEKS
ncbi:hypothetical protein [Rhodococcus sp. ACPA4]|uniref:hypothetical protein n=1 Tax=Rhodococcus sp. ACPA4 TaxID=2028571 RepID=UPI00211C3A85|nr:hypothetical protein [Rhodococcus sp. ACPA4]